MQEDLQPSHLLPSHCTQIKAAHSGFRCCFTTGFSFTSHPYKGPACSSLPKKPQAKPMARRQHPTITAPAGSLKHFHPPAQMGSEDVVISNALLFPVAFNLFIHL